MLTSLAPAAAARSAVRLGTPGDQVHAERGADPRHFAAQAPQPEQAEILARELEAKRGLPFAVLPLGVVLGDDVAHAGQDQAPGQFRRAHAFEIGAAELDAVIGGGGLVDRGVAPPRGDQQFEIGQALEQRARKRRALAHQHHALEGVQPLRQRVEIEDVVGEGLHRRVGIEAFPIGEAHGALLIIVEQGNAHHVEAPEGGWWGAAWFIQRVSRAAGQIQAMPAAA